MLEAMRKNTKVVLWITVGAFIALIFLVWGADSQLGGGGGASQGVIGRVNGEPIYLDYFNRVYQSSRENFRAQRGGELGPGDDARILQQTWDGIIEQMILTQEAERLGLSASDQEVVTAARNTPPQFLTQDPTFHTDGQFDQQKYLSFLDNPNVDPLFFQQLETYLRGTLPINKLTSMIYSGARVSTAEVQQAFRDRNDNARITYRLFETRNYPADAPATDEEARAYYDANPGDFDLPAQATVQYVRFDRSATEADIEEIRTQLTDYAAIARRFAAGDSNAQSFGVLAETYSDLPSALDGGFVDRFYGKGELTPELEAVVFALPSGGISEPVQDRAGFHIVQVDSIIGEADDKRVRYREFMIPVEASPLTITDLEESITDLRQKAEKGNLTDVATESGLTVQSPPPFEEGGFIRGLEAVPGAVDWAFEAGVGSISREFATNDAWYVLELTARAPKGRRPFNDVVELARQKATEQKQRDKARADAGAFLAAAQTAPTWRMAAGADSPSVRLVGPFTRAAGIPGLGRDAGPLAAAFALPVGQASRPFDVARGVLVLKVEDQKPADETLLTSQQQQITQQLTSLKRNEIYQDWLKEVRARASIDDFRDLYFRS